MAYVPMQASAEPAYNASEALTRGTLFPGLDLPFMNMVNTGDLTGTPLGELMALDFVAHELMLYLDTHENDKEAFEALQGALKLSAEAHSRYTLKYGPVLTSDLNKANSFTWIDNPWPWDYRRNTEV